jgi:hypothetical protein
MTREDVRTRLDVTDTRISKHKNEQMDHNNLVTKRLDEQDLLLRSLKDDVNNNKIDIVKSWLKLGGFITMILSLVYGVVKLFGKS